MSARVSRTVTSYAAEYFTYIKGASTLPFPGPSQFAIVLFPAFRWHYMMRVEVRKRGAVPVFFSFVSPAVCQ